MKLTNAIKIVKSAVKRGTKYEHINIRTTDGKTTISAVSPMMAISATVDSIGEINCALNGDKLASAVSRFGNDATISMDGASLVMKQGRSKVAIETVSQEHDPMPEIGDTTKCPSGVAAMIDRVLFAAGVSDVRPYINGVLVTSSGGTVNAVATDGHRLAWVSAPDGDEDYSAIVPRDAVSAIIQINGDVGIGLVISAQSEDATAVIQPIDGKYPDWTRVVPDCKHAATFDRDAMLDALQKSSVVAGEKVIPSKLTIGNGVIGIITMSQGRDCGESEIEATTGPAAEIGVNAKYMIDAVNAFAPGSAIGMEYSDGNSAFIMSDGSLNVVTMPMRI